MIRGVLNGKHVFSAKYDTAQIINENSRAFFVPIVHMFADCFFAILDKEIYLFSTADAQVNTYRETLARHFSFYIFHTNHYRPITNKLGDLRNFLQETGIEAIDPELMIILAALSKKETSKDFKPHELANLKKELDTVKSATAEALSKYIEGMPQTHIIKPTKTIRAYLTTEVKIISGKFLGNVVNGVVNAENYRSEMCNVPINQKKPLLKLALVMIMILGVAGLGYMAYEGGYLSSIGAGVSLPGLGDAAEVDYSPSALAVNYPSGKSMYDAIQAGVMDYDLLPDIYQKLIDDYDPATDPDNNIEPAEAPAAAEPKSDTTEVPNSLLDTLLNPGFRMPGVGEAPAPVITPPVIEEPAAPEPEPPLQQQEQNIEPEPSMFAVEFIPLMEEIPPDWTFEKWLVWNLRHSELGPEETIEKYNEILNAVKDDDKPVLADYTEAIDWYAWHKAYAAYHADRHDPIPEHYEGGDTEAYYVCQQLGTCP